VAVARVGHHLDLFVCFGQVDAEAHNLHCHCRLARIVRAAVAPKTPALHAHRTQTRRLRVREVIAACHHLLLIAHIVRTARAVPQTAQGCLHRVVVEVGLHSIVGRHLFRQRLLFARVGDRVLMCALRVVLGLPRTPRVLIAIARRNALVLVEAVAVQLHAIFLARARAVPDTAEVAQGVASLGLHLTAADVLLIAVQVFGFNGSALVLVLVQWYDVRVESVA